MKRHAEGLRVRISPTAYLVFGPDVLDQLDGLLEQARMEWSRFLF
jgi:hypothetical protein